MEREDGEATDKVPALTKAQLACISLYAGEVLCRDSASLRFTFRLQIL